MGIKNLLEFTQPACRTEHVKSFAGKAVAVDMYCWIHKGVSACAEDIILGRPTNMYVTYCVRRLTMLKNFGVEPIAVFDGRHLPSKAETEKRRAKDRSESRKRAADCYRSGNAADARKFAMRAVDVTSAMAREVIEAVRKMKIRYVVAPYEADAQLAYLNLRGIADVVITEDSDLIVFGCTRIFFKCDNAGAGTLYEQDKLAACFKERATNFTFEKFRRMCIFSGCDYLDSLKGIGIKKAFKIFSRSNVGADLWSQLKQVISLIKVSLTDVRSYMDKFIEAENTFLHQLVYDPELRKLAPLKDYPDGKNHVDFPYAGDWLEPEKALQTACGNYDLKTDEVVAKIDTGSWWRNVDRSALVRSAQKRPPQVPNILVSRRSLPAPAPKQNTLKDFFAKKSKSITRVASEDDEVISFYFKKKEESVSGDSGISMDEEKTTEVKVNLKKEKQESAVSSKPLQHLEAFSALSKFTTNARLRKTVLDPSAPKVESHYFAQTTAIVDEIVEPSPKKMRLSSPEGKRRNPFAVCNPDPSPSMSPDVSARKTPQSARNPFAVTSSSKSTVAVEASSSEFAMTSASSASGSPIVSYRRDSKALETPASTSTFRSMSSSESSSRSSPVVSKRKGSSPDSPFSPNTVPVSPVVSARRSQSSSLLTKKVNKSPAKPPGRSLLEAFGFSRNVSRFKPAAK